MPVHVVDSGTTGMSLGYAVLAAARVAGAGGGPRRVMDALARRLEGSAELIYVDTLEYLRKGGRIGAAAAFLGSALSLKPLLTMKGGQVAPLDRVLGTERALRRLVEQAVRKADGKTGRHRDRALRRAGHGPRSSPSGCSPACRRRGRSRSPRSAPRSGYTSDPARSGITVSPA